MVFQPGQSGNPKGGNSTRNRATREAFIAIKNAGYTDPLVALAKIAHESENEGYRVQANAAIVGYCHPKQQSIPATRYIENPVQVPEFTSVEIAEGFLAKITMLVAAGELDLDFGKELRESTLGWIQSQYAKQGIDLKAQAQGATDNQPLRIEASLAQLPGTNIIGFESYPVVDNDIHTRMNGQASAQKLIEPVVNPSTIDGVHTAEPAEQLPQNAAVATNGSDPNETDGMIVP